MSELAKQMSLSNSKTPSTNNTTTKPSSRTITKKKNKNKKKKNKKREKRKKPTEPESQSKYGLVIQKINDFATKADMMREMIQVADILDAVDVPPESKDDMDSLAQVVQNAIDMFPRMSDIVKGLEERHIAALEKMIPVLKDVVRERGQEMSNMHPAVSMVMPMLMNHMDGSGAVEGSAGLEGIMGMFQSQQQTHQQQESSELPEMSMEQAMSLLANGHSG